MKTWEEIDVSNVLDIEDFTILFQHLPLTREERIELIDYYKMYTTFIETKIDPETAWIAVRNLYTIKNQQIAERLKNK